MKIFGYKYNWLLVSFIILAIDAIVYQNVFGFEVVMKLLITHEIIGHSIVIVSCLLINIASERIEKVNQKRFEYWNS